MFAGILYIWMSTVGVLNHDDDFMYQHGRSVMSSHDNTVPTSDDGCIACQWMVGSVSVAVASSVMPVPGMLPRADVLPAVKAFHTHEFHNIPPRGPPAYS